MTEQKVKYKTLLALLYQFQERGLARFREEEERELCLQAASLYLVTLAITGSVISLISSLSLRSCWGFLAFQ